MNRPNHSTTSPFIKHSSALMPGGAGSSGLRKLCCAQWKPRLVGSTKGSKDLPGPPSFWMFCSKYLEMCCLFVSFEVFTWEVLLGAWLGGFLGVFWKWMVSRYINRTSKDSLQYPGLSERLSDRSFWFHSRLFLSLC